jgi:hypothetical protein
MTPGQCSPQCVLARVDVTKPPVRDEFGAGIRKPLKWPIVADARLAAKPDIDIAQTHKKCSLGIIPTHFSLFFFIFEEVNTVLDWPYSRLMI